jgi:predicted oxidoreductase
VSNHTASQMRALAAHLAVPMASIQQEFSPVAIEPLFDGVLDFALETGAATLAWSPLGGGRIANPGNDREWRVAKALDTIAARTGTSRAAVAYAWLLAHPARVVPLVGTQNPSRIQEAATALDITLSREDWYAVLVASRGERMP